MCWPVPAEHHFINSEKFIISTLVDAIVKFLPKPSCMKEMLARSARITTGWKKYKIISNESRECVAQAF